MKRVFWSLSILVVLSMVLAACGGGGGGAAPTTAPAASAPTTAPAAAAPTTEAAAPTAAAAAPGAGTGEAVTLAYWEQENSDVDAFLDDLGNEFMAANPNIKIERAHFGTEELRSQFQTAALAGEAPALTRGPNDNVGPFSALDIIMPADEAMDSAFFDQFIDGALEPALYNGKQWAVPDNYGNHLMLLYNKALVTGTIPTDTDAWIAQLKTLTDAGKGQYGLVYNLNEPFWVAPWIAGFGGWPLTDQNMPDLNTQAMKDAFQFLYDLKATHQVVPPEANYDAADTMFKQGQAAYLINGDWSLGGYEESGIDFGVAPLPKVSKTGEWPAPMTAGKYWYFTKGLEGAQLDAAKKFVEFMTSPEVQQRWLEQWKRLPSDTKTAESELIKNDPVLAGSMEQLTKGRGMPAAPQLRCVWDSMRPNLEGVMAGSATAEEAAANTQQNAENCVKEMGSATPAP